MRTCDISGCENERVMSWRPIGHERGYRVCRRHADRDHDPQDPFDLYEVFGLSRSEVKRPETRGIQSEANRKRSESQKGVPKREAIERGRTEGPKTFGEPGKQAKAAARVNMGAVARTCECGEPVAKGKRCCDGCRDRRRRESKRRYMQPYMRVRRRGLAGRATSRLAPQKAPERPVARKKATGRTYSPPLAETQTSVLTRGT
jgi:hypothetical protein